LQHGEYLSLGKIETELKTCQIVENICVIGDSTKTYCIALVQPTEKGLRELAASIDVSGSFSDICRNENVVKLAKDTISAHGVKRKLNKFEIPARIVLCKDLWTPDSGLVTAAFKIKRKEISAKYRSAIERVYV
jgi:long-chain acyl-CoA synthetase